MEENTHFTLMKIHPGLSENIIRGVHLEEERIAQRNQRISFGLACVSLVLCIGTALWLWSDLAHSAFIQSFSLIFSDRAIVLDYWQDFSSTLIEALPLVSLASCLGTVGAVIVSVYGVVKYRAKYNMLSDRLDMSGHIAASF